MRFQEENLHNFDAAIRDELVQDGYLSEDERIESLQWSDDTFKVNGKEIREKDREKYQALHEKYLGDRKGLRKAE